MNPEKRVNKALTAYKEAIVKGNRREIIDTEWEFMKSLYELPLDFKSLLIHLCLSPDDTRAMNLQELMGITSAEGVYVVQIPTPRKPNLSDIGTHGSASRERYLAVGEIETVKLIDTCDRQMNIEDTPALLINPVNIGAYSLEKRLGTYIIFPREINEIKLGEDILPYLTDEEKDFVEKWSNL